MAACQGFEWKHFQFNDKRLGLSGLETPALSPRRTWESGQGFARSGDFSRPRISAFSAAAYLAPRTVPPILTKAASYRPSESVRAQTYSPPRCSQDVVRRSLFLKGGLWGIINEQGWGSLRRTTGCPPKPHVPAKSPSCSPQPRPDSRERERMARLCREVSRPSASTLSMRKGWKCFRWGKEGKLHVRWPGPIQVIDRELRAIVILIKMVALVEAATNGLDRGRALLHHTRRNAYDLNSLFRHSGLLPDFGL